MIGIAGVLTFTEKLQVTNSLDIFSSSLKRHPSHQIQKSISSNAGFIQLFSESKESILSYGQFLSIDGDLFLFCGQISNKKELNEILSLGGSAKTITDINILISSYQKWGNDLVNFIVGDFCFAIFDKEKQSIFCARDQIGTKPIFYVKNNDYFAFSSDIDCLLSLNNSNCINNIKIAEYLTVETLDIGSTFYKDIFRLSPGHYIEVSSDHIKIHHYRKLKPAFLSPTDIKNYREIFFDLLVEAVRCRIDSTLKTGAFLSGGMDSSAIVSILSGPCSHLLQQPIHSYSGIFSLTKKCDETEYIHTVLSNFPNISTNFLDVDQFQPSIAFEYLSANETEPFWAPHFVLHFNIQKLAYNQDIKILFDGHDGDAAVSYGSGLLNELLWKLKLSRLFLECYTIGNKRSVFLALRRCAAVLKHNFSRKFPNVLHLLEKKNKLSDNLYYLNQDFAEYTQIATLLTEHNHSTNQGRSELEMHTSSISNPAHTLLLEFFDRLGRLFNTKYTFPFYDIRLIEFCLALPAELKLKNGLTRYVLRESLREYLPKTILERKTKTYFNPSVQRGFLILDNSWFFSHLDNLDFSIYTYVSKVKIDTLVQSLKNRPREATFDNIGFLLKIISLSQWLKRN
jgi:asparagine synthase (glutamine-hydrolysing)